MWLLVAAFLACFASSANGQNQTMHEMSFDDGNFNVSWTHNRSTEELEFEVNANAIGYVAFGFTFTPEDMQNYSIVVGGTNGSGQNYFNVSLFFFSFFKMCKIYPQMFFLVTPRELVSETGHVYCRFIVAHSTATYCLDQLCRSFFSLSV